ncbi:MAG: UDP-glucose 4-epimerase [Solirubrobacteraceae bacterium]|jgi:UDP-glucose 4-epimerase|nr:UDP-glucose 4-epimerase [Solirubrobacteraceae bacterium]
MRRVLVTGAANRLGTVLVAELLDDPQIELVVALDTRTPDLPAHDRLVHLEADLRSPDLARLLAPHRITALLHNDLLQFPEPGRSARLLHDTNVVGTLGLLAAAEAQPELRTVVVRSSATIYGSEPNAPAFFTEEMADRFPLRTRWQRDTAESEKLVAAFGRRRPEVACTALRFQPILGRTLDTPIMRLLGSPVIPTWMGFDPMIQVIHGDDAVEAMVLALRAAVRGPVNVAAEGTVSLSRVMRRLGKTAIPIVPGAFGPVVGLAARLGLPRMDEDTMRFLHYGRGVDVTRMRTELGFEPTLSSIGAIEIVAMAIAEAA